MALIQGKEKAWAALLGGGTVTALTVLAIWATSQTGAIEPPTPDEIRGAVIGLVAAIAAAASAYLATNSTPTNISVPAEPVTHPDGYDPIPSKEA